MERSRRRYQVYLNSHMNSSAIIEEQIVPLYTTQTNTGSDTLNDKYVALDDIKIPNLPKCDGALYVTGDSMAPIIRAGDIVCYKTAHCVSNHINYGIMYLLSFTVGSEEYRTIKYIYPASKDGYCKLVSYNPEYEPHDIPIDSINAMGIVQASIRLDSIG